MRNSWMLALVATTLLIASCKKESAKEPLTPYEELIANDTDKGKQVDSLFFVFKLGQDGREFYDYCQEKNKEGTFKSGPQNMSVNYVLDTERGPLDMNFYPEFVDGKISAMIVEFRYQAWNPWTPELQSDSAILDVMEKFQKDYGDDFLVEQDIRGRNVYVDVDGNRKIIVEEKLDGSTVKAVFTDLNVIDS